MPQHISASVVDALGEGGSKHTQKRGQRCLSPPYNPLGGPWGALGALGAPQGLYSRISDAAQGERSCYFILSVLFPPPTLKQIQEEWLLLLLFLIRRLIARSGIIRAASL